MKKNNIWQNIDFKKLNYFNIIKGWFKKLIVDKLSLIPYHEKQQQIIRYSHCQNCPLNTNGWCDTSKEELDIYGNLVKGCGCELIAKTLSPNEHCPRSLWLEMLNQEEWNNYIIKVNEYYITNNKPEVYQPTEQDFQIINALLYGTPTPKDSKS